MSWTTRVYKIELWHGYFATEIESSQLKNDRHGTHGNQSVAFCGDGFDNESAFRLDILLRGLGTP